MRGGAGVGNRERRASSLSRGWIVGGDDVNEAGLNEMCEESGEENCRVRRLDVTNRAEYRAALDEFAPAAGGGSAASTRTPASAVAALRRAAVRDTGRRCR